MRVEALPRRTRFRRVLRAKLAEWTIAADCKSAVRKGYLGSNPRLGTIEL